MPKAAVVIGVDRAGHLPVLQGAASGAEKFARWAIEQGFETILCTDAAQRGVPVGQIKEIIRGLVELAIYEQLIVHFSGHGVLGAPGCEVWLLSGAPADPNEAVDVSRSIRLARDSGIPHVVFISDACRTTSNPRDLAEVDGSSIFPNRPSRPPRAQVDQFYASLPGDPANETLMRDQPDRYTSVYNDCLLQGLSFPGPDLIEEMVIEGRPTRVVPSWHLKTYLEGAVPRAAADVHIGLQQDPDAMVESRPPKYLSRLPDSLIPEDTAGGPTGGRGGGMPRVSPGSTLDSLRDTYYLGKAPLAHLISPRLHGGTVDAIEKMMGVQGRVAFETRTGFSVVGTTISSAEVSDGRCDVFAEDSPSGPNHVRVHPTGRPTSALIEFQNGTGTCLAVIPGFIATVVVEREVVISVSYTPSRGTPRYSDYEMFRERIEARRAFAAVAARNGVFRIAPDEAARYGDFLREYKSIDPALGLYAAYAFAQVGMIEEIASIAQYMREGGLPPLFDIALLQHSLQESELGTLTPLGPMLTQGWKLLGDEGQVPDEYRDARRQLLPALWTTLTPRGTGMMRARFRAAAYA